MKQKTHIKLNLHKTSGILRALIHVPDTVFRLSVLKKIAVMLSRAFPSALNIIESF